jgi:hypothetical protein
LHPHGRVTDNARVSSGYANGSLRFATTPWFAGDLSA